MRFEGWIVPAVAGLVFVGTITAPPSLLDDVDTAYAGIARAMLDSGDWITARLNGVPYFDKPPGQVWLMALSYSVFGVHDWSSRLPVALAAVALCWLAWRCGRWAFGRQAGLYAGVGLATCWGIFLFTRVRIPDIYIACTSLLALDCFLRALEQESGRRARALMAVAGASLGAGILFKGLVAIVLPLGAMAVFTLLGGSRGKRLGWRRMGLPGATLVMAAVAAPWHVLATLRNPPLLDLSLDSGPGLYRGFFWRYFVNEHLLRYLGLRHPHDYSRIAVHWFWLGHLAWLFPWSGLLLGARWPGRGHSRAARCRLMMLCFCGTTLLFFSFSTNQEYYTLAAYAPALLLLADIASTSPRVLRSATRLASSVHSIGLAAGIAVLVLAIGTSPAGDISDALSSNPEQYTRALGHLHDLTLESFAHLRGPLLLALAGCALAAPAGWVLGGRRAAAILALVSVLHVHAAHWAMAAFDPHLSSRSLGEAYLRCPPGDLVLDHEYYAFSSVAYYANRNVLLLNGRKNNIEYGSNAPGAPDVFLDDAALERRWTGSDPLYLVTYAADRGRLEALLGPATLHPVLESGGKLLLSNRPSTRCGGQDPVPAGL